MKNTLKESIKAFGVKQVLSYIEKDPETNIPKALNWLQSHDKDHGIQGQLKTVQESITNENSKWHKYAMDIYRDIDPNVRKKFMENFVINAGMLGIPYQKRLEAKYEMNIPWTILFDPTSACNLHCTGCWAAEYSKQLNLSLETMDKIVTEGKELGIYFYLMTGGEPLVRKADILKLAKKHSDCFFHIFTNATLIDEDFCKEVQACGNISFAISLEGFEETNDSRRGSGNFKAVTHGMDLLKKYGLLFAVSVCYTSQNYKVVTSDEYLDMIIEKGAKIVWYFHYMPVGNDAAPELLLSPEQREYMYHKIRSLRADESGKAIFPIDFQNDGEYIGGCIAGGRNYMHINPNGDVEPCVFIHYSSANIKEVSLFESLKQPLFKAYADNQPFNGNHLRPCPMLENPLFLQKMVKETGAKSTDMTSPESAEHLCGKCTAYAANWASTADKLWVESGHKIDTKCHDCRSQSSCESK